MERKCANCRHYFKTADEYPCNDCKNLEHFELAVDAVNHPKHYADTCSLECIDAMLITFGTNAVIDFCMCNAFKYLWRYKNKNGQEDLKKCEWYLKKAYDLGDDSERLNVMRMKVNELSKDN